MMTMIYRNFGWWRSLSALSMLLATASGAHAFQNDGTVRIGLIESKTGPYTSTGLPGLVGSQIAIDEINSGGGILVGGKKVKLDVSDSGQGYDGGSDVGVALTTFKRTIFDDKVLMIKGPSVSNQGQAVFSYLNELDAQGSALVVMSSSIGAPNLPKISKWAFRNIFAETDIVPKVAAKAAKETGATTAAFFLQKDNIYYPAMSDIVRAALDKLGIRVVAVAETIEADRDLTRQVDQLRSANPDLIYLLANSNPSLNFLREARRRGLKPKYFVGGIPQLNTETMKYPAVLDGTVLAGPFDPASPGLNDFAAEYRKRTGLDINTYAVNAYEAIYLIKDAIEKSGIANTPETLQPDRTAFRDALATKASIVSPTGETLKFSQDRETPKQGVFLIFKDGKLQLWK